MNRFERRPLLTLCAVLLIMVGALLFVSEALLRPEDGTDRVVGGDSELRPERFLALREWRPLTRFSFGPPESRIANANGDLLDVYPLDTDRFGFIEPSVIHEDPDMEIVFVGGSTTENMYVAPENRFPYLAGRLLEERTGLKVNGINAGKSGNNAMLSLLATIGKVLPRRPDYVVLKHNVNDLAVLRRHGSYWSADSDAALLRTRERSFETVARDLRDMTIPYSYRVARRALRRISSDRSAMAAETDRSDERLPRAAASFESALRSFVAVARAWNVDPVLMTQVSLKGLKPGQGGPQEGAYLDEERLARGNFSPQSFARAHDYFNAIVRHVALTEDVALIDLAKAQRWNEPALYDRLHFTDSGSRQAAEIIATEMERLLRTDRSPNKRP